MSFIEKLNNSIRTDLIEEKEINTKEKDLNEGKENSSQFQVIPLNNFSNSNKGSDNIEKLR